MTNPKWLIGIAVAFVLMTLLSGVLEGGYLSGAAATRLQLLISMPFPPTISWISNLWGMLWFDYSFFHGGWVIFKYALFWPISFGLVVSYAFLLLQAMWSGVRGLVSVFTGGAV